MANMQDVIKAVSAQRIFLDVSRNRITEELKLVDQHATDMGLALGQLNVEVIKLHSAAAYMAAALTKLAEAEAALKNAEAELRSLL